MVEKRFLVFGVFLVLSLGVVSAGLFGDWFGKSTGKAISVERVSGVYSICSDFDGKNNFLTASKVVQGGRTYHDFCSGNMAYDYYCPEWSVTPYAPTPEQHLTPIGGYAVKSDDGVSRPKTTQKDCSEYGASFYCDAGACVDNQTNETTCYDSDGGLEAYVYGHIENKGFEAYDSCSDANTVSETFCVDEDNHGWWSIDCENGCVDGVCILGNQSNETHTECIVDSCIVVSGPGVSECSVDLDCVQGNQTNETTCLDSDGGINYYVKGSVFTGTSNFTDFCLNSTGVREYYCGNGSLNYIPNHYCENGCVDGACVEDCVPDCSGYECGIDPVCGTLSCGYCGGGETCVDGFCISNNTCEILDAFWALNGTNVSVDEGDYVQLVVQGSPGCDGAELAFEVWEDDFIFPDDPVQINPANTFFNGQVAVTGWFAEWQVDGFPDADPPEYYFRVFGDFMPTGDYVTSSPPNLPVYQSENGTI